MKKLVSFLCLCFLFVNMISCQAKEEEFIYVLLDFEPKIEIVIDNSNTIKAINGLNDEGKMLLYDEAYNEKKLEDVLPKIIKQYKDLGYIVTGSIKEFSQTIEISVTGSMAKDDLHIIEMKINESIQDEISSLKLNAQTVIKDTLQKDYLVTKVLSSKPWLAKETIETMDTKELMLNVKEAVLENSQFASLALESFYASLKEYEFKTKYKNILFESIDDEYADLKRKYQELVNDLEEAIGEFKTEENLSFDVNTNYAYAKENYFKGKVEFLVLRAQISKKDTNELYSALNLQEDALKQLYSNLLNEEKNNYAKVNNIIINIDTIYAKLEELEKDFPYDFDFTKAKEKAENYISGAQDNLKQILENTLTKERILKINTNINNQKKELKNRISSIK